MDQVHFCTRWRFPRWQVLQWTQPKINRPVKDSRIAGIATIPGREESLRDVFVRICPQVDEVYVSCNKYTEQHPLQVSGDHPKNVAWWYPCIGPDWSCGREDNNKFLFLGLGTPGYRFPLDDDVLHPHTYIEDTIQAIEDYKREYVVSWGGKRFDKRPIRSYYRSASMRFHGLHDQAYDCPVHIPLSGAMAWHTSMITFDIEEWVHPLMADIWAGLDCLKKGVPIMALSHDKGYLVHTTKIDRETTIFFNHRFNDAIQTSLVASQEWPPIPAHMLR